VVSLKEQLQSIFQHSAMGSAVWVDISKMDMCMLTREALALSCCHLLHGPVKAYALIPLKLSLVFNLIITQQGERQASLQAQADT